MTYEEFISSGLNERMLAMARKAWVDYVALLRREGMLPEEKRAQQPPQAYHER